LSLCVDLDERSSGDVAVLRRRERKRRERGRDGLTEGERAREI